MKEQYQKLAKLALEARRKSYSPYSDYRVGAALLCEDGSIYTGCNIENAAYGPSVCAERTAFFKAVSEGKRGFAAIAVAGSPAGADDVLPQYACPCGTCRQVMREFCEPEEFVVLIVRSEQDYRQTTLSGLLPDSFGPDNVKIT